MDITFGAIQSFHYEVLISYSETYNFEPTVRLVVGKLGIMKKLRVYDLKAEGLHDTGTFLDGQDPRLVFSIGSVELSTKRFVTFLKLP